MNRFKSAEVPANQVLDGARAWRFAPGIGGHRAFRGHRVEGSQPCDGIGRRRLSPRVVACSVVLAVLTGCASFPGSDPRDPLEPLNRRVFEFNDSLDTVIIRPVATVYRDAVPALVRTGVSNFFGNLADAWAVVNNLLQFEFRAATDSFARVHINTFIGIGGIFDVASDLNVEKHREDFGLTLGHWGVPAGPYIVLPLLGPSTLRDALAIPVDAKGDLTLRLGTQEFGALYTLRAIDRRANLLRIDAVVDQAALDRYSFTREAYMQWRRARVLGDRNPENGGDQP